MKQLARAESVFPDLQTLPQSCYHHSKLAGEGRSVAARILIHPIAIMATWCPGHSVALNMIGSSKLSFFGMIYPDVTVSFSSLSSSSHYPLFVAAVSCSKNVVVVVVVVFTVLCPSRARGER